LPLLVGNVTSHAVISPTLYTLFNDVVTVPKGARVELRLGEPIEATEVAYAPEEEFAQVGNGTVTVCEDSAPPVRSTLHVLAQPNCSA
jgi:hypothetical protein